jgi:hypothetical protein
MARHSLKVSDVGRFSIDDDDNRLYWDDKIIQTESVIILKGRQGFWAGVLTGAAIVSALATAFYSATYLYVTFVRDRPVPVQQTAQPATPAPPPIDSKPQAEPQQKTETKQKTPDKLPVRP